MILLKYNDFVIQNDQSETKLQHRQGNNFGHLHYITITFTKPALYYNYMYFGWKVMHYITITLYFTKETYIQCTKYTSLCFL